MKGHKGAKEIIRILVIESDSRTVCALSLYLLGIEHELINLGKRLAVTVLPEYDMVKKYINKDKSHSYDIILLDRYCMATEPKHAVNLKKLDMDKVIAISAMTQLNQEVEDMGAERAVWKDYANLSGFADKVTREVRDMLGLPEPPKDDPQDDPIYREAVEVIKETNKVSTSFLQDRLKIGYARAARLLEYMEEEGLISAANGREPRVVHKREDTETDEGDKEMGEPLFDEAVRIVRAYDKASASLLQRELQIRYARAARLLDILEEKGIISAVDANKPRDVLE